jgi:hypothetical protein
MSRHAKKFFKNFLREAIETMEGYIEHHNQNPKPFKWTASAEMILGKVEHLCNSLA